MKIILQKFIADSGFCSRRKAEDLIRSGKIFVNGKKAESGMKAGEGDEVKINGKRLTLAKEKVYIKLNKPKGYTSTAKKFKNEKNVFDLVGTQNFASLRGTRLFIVGRLDKDSRGLILLTNDGGFAQKMTHPKYEHEKEYIVETGRLGNSEIRENEIVKKFKQGIAIGEGDGIAKAKEVRYLGKNKFKIILTEGKKRQIRRMFKKLGYEVVDILRVRIGKAKLGDLKEGKWECVPFLTKED